MGVGDAIVHGGQAGGAGVGEIGDLDGRGFVGESEQAAGGHVHVQVDQDVDLIRADLGGEVGVAHALGEAPGVGAGADFFGDGVGGVAVGVAGDLKLGAVVIL